VKNEWLVGSQHVVARVRAEADGVIVESHDPETWNGIILRPLPREDAEKVIDPKAHPKEFLDLLPKRIHGSYLFATEVHADEECPFREHRELPIRSLGSPHRPTPI
jgi:hypothetical protein